MNLRARACLPLSTLLLAAGCSADGPALPDAPPPGAGLQYRMVSTIEAGQEIERCQFFRVPDEGFYVNHDEVRYSPGSHHVLLYKTPYMQIPTKDQRGRDHDTSGVFDCADGATADWAVTGVVAGAQSSAGDPMVSMPPGVGIHVPGGTVVLMNTHYLNASAKPLVADARINLYTIPKAEVQQEGGLLFFYNPFIHIPAIGRASARLRCAVSSDITLTNIQSHMHRRGVGYEASWLGGDGKPIEKLYENTAWEQVPVKRFEPGKALAKGTALDYRCDYANPEDRTVIQGARTSDEMCMLIGSYYPRVNGSLEGCDQPVFVGTGEKSCAETVLCAAGAKDQEPFYGCVVDSCPGVANEMTAALRCAFSQGNGACTATCRDSPASCQGCIQQACKAPLDACFAARCQ